MTAGEAGRNDPHNTKELGDERSEWGATPFAWKELNIVKIEKKDCRLDE